MDHEDRFTAVKALQLGFEKYSQDPGYCWCVVGAIEFACFLASVIATFHVVLVAQLLFQLDAPPLDSYVIAFFACYFLIRTTAQPLMSRWLVSMAKGNRQSPDELLGFDVAAHLPIFFKNAAGTLVVTVYTTVGTLLLVVPGLIAVSSLRFYKFLVLSKDESAIASVRDSFDLSFDHLLQLVLLHLFSLGLKAGGLLLFVIGLVPALAVCGLAEACAYQELKAYQRL